MQNAPVQESVVQSAPATVVQPSAPAQQIKPAPAASTVAPAAKIVSKPAVPATKIQTAPKTAQPVVNTPTIKTVKSSEPKKVVATAPKPTAEPVQKTAAAPKTAAEPAPKAATEAPAKTAVKASDTTGTYYIQVGSFSKEPNKALFDRLNASGLKYTTVPAGAATKVMVGPFQGEKAARDVLGTVKRNVEAGAYITKG